MKLFKKYKAQLLFRDDVYKAIAIGASAINNELTIKEAAKIAEDICDQIPTASTEIITPRLLRATFPETWDEEKRKIFIDMITSITQGGNIG